MGGDLHVAGVLVHAKAARLAAVRAAIELISGSEVHATSPEGKLVVTLEMTDSKLILDRISDIKQIEGVVSAALVYQHNEPLDCVDKEMSHDHHSS